ncbi:F0F1 ATP synthase subunit epsilon [Spirosoma sp. SC4-14]|uniref:F0F1 ATP synthase subunit epsilon n=1 Tax=Spirosoma sp. SC4-14 TaxID=3128900 RepID=UPI0030D5192F
MTTSLIHLKVLLPGTTFADIQDATRLVVETAQGAYGLWPSRLDCVAALVPGILTYETKSEEECYMAIGEGILVKTGQTVLVSVRQAIASTSLSQLRRAIETELLQRNDQERRVHEVLSKLESGFIRQFETFRRT